MPDANGLTIGQPGYNKSTDPSANPFYVAPGVTGPASYNQNIDPNASASNPTGGTGGSASSGAPGIVPLDPATGQPLPSLASQPGSIGSTATTDPSVINRWIAYWSTLPGADPTLRSNPGYWSQKIISTGGLSDANTTYWQGLGINNWQGKGPDASGGGGIGAPTVDPYTLPGGAPGAYTTPAPFTTPTLNDLLTSPGFQAGSDLLSQQLARSGAAKGSILSGGYGTALAKAQTDYATNDYGNLYNQALSAYQTNTGTALSGQQQNVAQYQNAVANTLSQYQQRYNAYQGAITNQFNLASLGKPTAVTPPTGA